MKSTLFSINWLDLGRGALMAAITAALAIITLSIESGALPTIADLKKAGVAAAIAGIAYIIKNFFTDTTAASVKRIEAAGGAVVENNKLGQG